MGTETMVKIFFAIKMRNNYKKDFYFHYKTLRA